MWFYGGTVIFFEAAFTFYGMWVWWLFSAMIGLYIKVSWFYCLIPLLYHESLRANGAKCFYHIYSRYWWTSLILYWCLLHLKAVLVCNWCSKSTCFMPMGEAVDCAVIDLKVAVIPLKDVHLAFNWISSAGSRETKREDLTCLTLCFLSSSCQKMSCFQNCLLCKSYLSLCDERMNFFGDVQYHGMRW